MRLYAYFDSSYGVIVDQDYTFTNHPSIVPPFTDPMQMVNKGYVDNVFNSLSSNIITILNDLNMDITTTINNLNTNWTITLNSLENIINNIYSSSLTTINSYIRDYNHNDYNNQNTPPLPLGKVFINNIDSSYNTFNTEVNLSLQNFLNYVNSIDYSNFSFPSNTHSGYEFILTGNPNINVSNVYNLNTSLSHIVTPVLQDMINHNKGFSYPISEITTSYAIAAGNGNIYKYNTFHSFPSLRFGNNIVVTTPTPFGNISYADFAPFNRHEVLHGCDKYIKLPHQYVIKDETKPLVIHLASGIYIIGGHILAKCNIKYDSNNDVDLENSEFQVVPAPRPVILKRKPDSKGKSLNFSTYYYSTNLSDGSPIDSFAIGTNGAYFYCGREFIVINPKSLITNQYTRKIYYYNILDNDTSDFADFGSTISVRTTDINLIDSSNNNYIPKDFGKHYLILRVNNQVARLLIFSDETLKFYCANINFDSNNRATIGTFNVVTLSGPGASFLDSLLQQQNDLGYRDYHVFGMLPTIIDTAGQPYLVFARNYKQPFPDFLRHVNDDNEINSLTDSFPIYLFIRIDNFQNLNSTQPNLHLSIRRAVVDKGVSIYRHDFKQNHIGSISYQEEIASNWLFDKVVKNNCVSPRSGIYYQNVELNSRAIHVSAISFPVGYKNMSMQDSYVISNFVLWFNYLTEKITFRYIRFSDLNIKERLAKTTNPDSEINFTLDTGILTSFSAGSGSTFLLVEDPRRSKQNLRKYLEIGNYLRIVNVPGREDFSTYSEGYIIASKSWHLNPFSVDHTLTVPGASLTNIKLPNYRRTESDYYVYYIRNL